MKNEFPLKSKAVLQCFYADDGTLCADDDYECNLYKLYDLVGWIAPVVVMEKILSIWRCKTDWDTIVPIELQNRFHDFRSTLTAITQITIPRWLGISKRASIQIHGFSDASKKAYGVAFYIRVEDGSNIQCG